jgi:hypothetical protein
MSKRTEDTTTIWLPATDRDTVKSIASSRGFKVKHAPGVLAEGWKLLTEEQAALASLRYFQRASRSRRTRVA